MPVYATTNNPTAIYQGDSLAVISSEASSVYPSGTATKQAALTYAWDSQPLVSAEVQFSANPGAFEIDIQTADTDTANAYQNVPNAAITSATQASGTGNFFGRFEALVGGKFVRLNVKTQTANAVTIVSATLT